MQSVNALQIFATAQQTSCRAIQLDIRENVKSALRKQTGEYLQTYGVWFSKCFAAVSNKYVMMTIQKLPVALEQYLCCTQIQYFNITFLATCLPSHTRKYQPFREIVMPYITLSTEEHGYCGRYTLTRLTENNKKHSAQYVTGDPEYRLRFLSCLC